MAIPNKQIGWSQKANLLWEISRQLDRINSVVCTGTCPTTTTTSTSSSSTTTTTTTEAIPSVLIGEQRWSLTNLEVVTYNNGDPIPQVTDPNEWINLTTGAWCYYNNDPANGAVYGKLYNWYAVNDPRGIAPTGWHVPTDVEWGDLCNFTDPASGGGTITPNTAGGPLKQTGTTTWNSPNLGATNTTGFTGLPGGSRVDFDGNFYNISIIGAFWTSTDINISEANMFYMTNAGPEVAKLNFPKIGGVSVRLIKD
jgi:uncharacterized protein (TIGR02145 family)